MTEPNNDKPSGTEAHGGLFDFTPKRPVETIDGGPVHINEINPGIPGVVELAKRLNVPPYESVPGGWSYVLYGSDGKHYELMALIHAVLDRLDEATRE